VTLPDEVELATIAATPDADSEPKRDAGTRTRKPRSDKGQSRSGTRTPSPGIPGQRAARRGSVNWVRGQVVTLVGLGNLALAFLSRDDMLSTEPLRQNGLIVQASESDLLADALTAEALASDRILKWMMVAAGVSPHILMIQALVVILIPRLQRRGILRAPTPEQQEAMNREFSRYSGEARPSENGSSPDTSIPSFSMEAGRTSGDSWPNG
jgi:hypothetical protein